MPTLASLWLDTVERAPRPALAQDVHADVCVVGAGITGLSAALELARGGRSVVVLEGRFVGAGASGYNTAKLSSLHGLTYAKLERSLGGDAARSYGQANQRGLERAFELADELGVDCELRRKPNLTYSESPDDREQLEAEVEAARRAGLPAALVEETDLPFPVAAAVRFADQAEFHPVKFLHGLARGLEASGARLFEGTFAEGVDAGSPCRVRTDGGRVVTASTVVVATHLPFLDRGLYFARCHPERSYVVAGRVPQRPAGMYLSTESPAHSIRAHGDWLLVGGESHKTGQADAAERYERLGARARERFRLEPELRWATQDQMPMDGVPYVGRHDLLSPNIWVATGFKKWGLAMGTAASELLTAQIVGRNHEWSALFNPNRLRARASAVTFATENANVAYHFAADRVLKHGAPRCTHLGCVLDWNSVEETWDCPCHGSRFGGTGDVIEGPAVKPLDSPPSPPGQGQH